MPTKPPVPIREKLVAASAALTLAYSAWGFGGVIAWSLHIMLAGGLVTFFLAVLPFPKTFSLSTFHLPLQSPRRLARTPAFYFIALFLSYLAIAAANPTWRIVSDNRGWWLAAVEARLMAWLPGSVDAPYEPMNAWRIFNHHLAAFSLALGLKIGLKHRRMILLVLWSMVGSGVAMAAVGIAQHFSGAEKVLWTMASENPRFWGSFFYRNQGAAFLYWIIVVAAVLYFYHLRQAREKAALGGPHFLAFAFIGIVLVSNAFAISRAGILISAALVAAFLAIILLDAAVHLFRARHSWKNSLVVGLLLTLLFSSGSYLLVQSVDWGRVEERLGSGDRIKQELKTGDRVMLRKATLEMAQDQILTGWGPGSFRYVFPMYQQKYPELFYSDWLVYQGEKGRDFYRYAHTDLVQFLAEYGIVGVSLLALSVLSLLLPSLRLGAFWLGLFLLLGVACIVVHAFLDFIFHSPSVWTAFIGSLGAVGRLVQLDRCRA